MWHRVVTMRRIGLLCWLMILIGVYVPIDSQDSAPIFVDVSDEAGIAATHDAVWDVHFDLEGYLAIGLAWGDYDNDGLPDLYVTGNRDPNVLYRNNGDGTFSVSPFSQQASLPDVESGGVVWVDYDNDGWRDLFVVNDGANTLFRNEQGNGFADVTAQAGLGDTGRGTSSAWGDYDSDGFLDVYVTNWSCYPECDPVDFTLQQDRFYHNNGDGTFTDVTDTLIYEKTLGAGFAVSFWDYDNDGDPDLYVVNDKLQNEIGNVLWRNDGAGCGSWCWTDMSVAAGLDMTIFGMGVDASDYDNDGDFDLYVTDMVYTMYLMTNNGAGVFQNDARSAGVAINYAPDNNVAWGNAFFDYNNDGWQDLFVALTAYVQELPQLYVELTDPRPNALFENNTDGTFTDVSAGSGIDTPHATLGVAYADYNRDGWVDLATGNWDEGYRLYQNMGATAADNHWIAFDLSGDGETVNRDAVGSRVYVQTDNGIQQMQEIKIGSGLGASNDTTLHFGLGQSSIEEVVVRWSNGDLCKISNLAPNQVLSIQYNRFDNTEGICQ